MTIKVSDYVMERLAAEVGHVFFLPGGGRMHLVDSVRRQEGLTPVVCLHEQAVAIAADAYSQYTCGLGAALVTAGPGSTNAITGVAGVLDSTPYPWWSCRARPRTARADRRLARPPNGHPGSRHRVARCSGHQVCRDCARTVVDPPAPRPRAASLPRRQARAGVARHPPGCARGKGRRRATGRRGRGASLGRRGRPTGRRRSAGGCGDHGRFDSATRGVRWCLPGNGIRQAGALELFLHWVTRAGLPVLTTWKAADFLPDDHALYVGRPGSVGQRGANFALQNADLLLAVGARLDLPQVGFDYGHFAPRARKVVVDVDRAESRQARFRRRRSRGGRCGPLSRRTRGRAFGLGRPRGLAAPLQGLAGQVSCRACSRGGLVGRGATCTCSWMFLGRRLGPRKMSRCGSSGKSRGDHLQVFRVKVGSACSIRPAGVDGLRRPESIGAAVAQRRR